jgi:hypothetical protein
MKTLISTALFLVAVSLYGQTINVQGVPFNIGDNYGEVLGTLAGEHVSFRNLGTDKSATLIRVTNWLGWDVILLHFLEWQYPSLHRTQRVLAGMSYIMKFKSSDDNSEANSIRRQFGGIIRIAEYVDNPELLAKILDERLPVEKDTANIREWQGWDGIRNEHYILVQDKKSHQLWCHVIYIGMENVLIGE